MKQHVTKKFSLLAILLTLGVVYSYAGETSKAESAFFYIEDNVICTEQNSDLVSQLVLAPQSDMSTLHIISHGKPGALLVDGQWLSGTDLTSFLSSVITPATRHINIYGCNFAQTAEAKSAISTMAKILHVTIAASDDITGADGDWELEYGQATDVLSAPLWTGNLQCSGAVGGYLPTDDFDGDGYCNDVDLDNDNDGIPDQYETCNTITTVAASRGAWCYDGDSIVPQSELVKLQDGALSDFYSSPRTDNIDHLHFYYPSTDNVTDIRIYNGDGTNNAPTDRHITSVASIKFLDAIGNTLHVMTNVALVNGGQTLSLGNTLYNVSRVELKTIAPVANTGIALRGVFLRGCDADTDNDGISDLYDLDSDGDGCPDAIENNRYQLFGIANNYNNVDSRMMLVGPVGSTGSAMGVPYSQRCNPLTGLDPYTKSAECDGCNPASTLYNDTDGDGIADLCDLDNDNDGHLDVDEKACSGSDNIVDYSINPVGTDLAGTTVPGTQGGFTVSHLLTGNAGAWKGPESGAQEFNIARNGTDYNNPMVMTHTFNKPLTNLEFSFRDIDYQYGGSEHVEIEVYYQNNPVFPIVENKGVNIQSVGTYAYEALTAGGNILSYDNGVDLEYGTQLVDQIIIRQWHTNNAANQGVLYNYEGGCVVIDSDGDGTPDYLDSDSDGDGCPDSLEVTGDVVDYTKSGCVTPDTVSYQASCKGCPIVACPVVNDMGTRTTVSQPTTTPTNMTVTGPDANGCFTYTPSGPFTGILYATVISCDSLGLCDTTVFALEDDNTILSLGLESFRVTSDQCSNTIIAKFAGDTENEIIEIQKTNNLSTDFETIAQETLVDGQLYYSDRSQGDETSYYRLKYSNDGKTVHSGTVSVNSNCNGSQFDAHIYPNPSTGYLKLELHSAEQASYIVRVTDAIGRTVSATTVQSSTAPISLDLSDQTSGMYLLTILDANGNTKYQEKVSIK